MFGELIFYLRVAALGPQFAANPFLAAMMVGLFLRFQWIEGPQSTFITQPWVLVAMGVMALGQAWVETETDLREFWYSVDNYVKTAIYFVVAQEMVDPASVFVFNMVIGQVSPVVFVWSWLTSVGMWVVNGARKIVYEFFGDADEDDDLGVQFFAVLTENTWVLVGVWLALILPVLALVMAGIGVLVVYWMEKRAEAAEDQRRIECGYCRNPIHPMALSCCACGATNPAPVQVNMLGQPTPRPVMDTESHRTKLISLRRCPVCASRLPSKGVQQTCSVCNAVTFASQSDLDRYLSGVNKQLPVTLVVCFLLGLLPVLGLLPGIIYYRFTLVSKVKRYMPRHIGFQAKWGVRILNGVLILLQPIPFVGAFLLMLMCYSNYVIYRGLLEREGRWVWRNTPSASQYSGMEQPRPIYTQPPLE